MDLKSFLPGKSSKVQVEYFWAISIEPGLAHAGIWYIEGDTAKMASVGAPARWELEEDLINSIDASLSTAIKEFPEEFGEPSKTVFGLNADWIDGGEIKENYLEKLRKICGDLSLNPIGFVVIPEAIANYYKVKENSPLNAVLVGVYEKGVEITLFSAGKLLGTVNVSRSVSIVDDISEGIVRFSTSSSIPSRIIIYDGKEGELDEIAQTLIKVNWDDVENIEFLHTPKVDIVSPDMKIEAVTLAGATETAGVKLIDGMAKEVEEPETLEETYENKDETPLVSGEEIPESGFVVDKDISEIVESDDSPATASTAAGEVPFRVEDYGSNDFHENPDVSSHEELGRIDHDNIKPAEFPPAKDKKAKVKMPAIGGKIKNGVGRGFGLLRGLSFNKTSAAGEKKALSLGLVFLLLLLVAGVAAWWYLPKANITIYVSPKTLNENATLRLVTSGETNLDEMVVAANLVESESSGEKSKSTTGTKVVGDKATGEVSIYRVGPSQTLAAGTILRGPNNLDFTLNEAVSLASGSASTASVAQAKVAAEDIGAQYNLASNTSFTVSNFSSADMEAKNESSFTGGSSREISAVSASDQAALREELEGDIETNSLEKLKEKVSDNQIVVDESFSADSEDVNFSAKVGDEATTLKLSMTLKSSVLTIDKDVLADAAKKVLEGKVPEGFVLRADQLKYDFSKRGEGDEYELKVSANFLPQVDNDKVRQDIRGKYSPLAKEYFINQLPGFVRAEIVMSPPLPGRLGSLPRVAKNIDIEIASER